MSSVVVPKLRTGTDVFLIARAAQELASWGRWRRRNKRWESQIKAAISREGLRRRKSAHAYDNRTKTGLVDLHRQMDTQDFVFAERQAPSPWAVAPPAWERIAAHADQNSPQSRIRGFNRQTCDEIEGHHCRVFADQTGKDNHRSTSRHVPLGKAIPHGRER